MDLSDRIERGVESAVRYASANGCPDKLAKAIHYAVFPGGARIRPKLCLAIALACGDREPAVATAAATAIELLHCASLVHDDLPCFDDAQTRRGKPTVHIAYGEEIALLTGDGLIVAAFETLARELQSTPDLIAPLVTIIGRAVGSPYGLVAGQAWESEPVIDVKNYHRAKTAALFTGAVMAGAVAARGNPEVWRALGDALGSAYQVADDLYDAVGDENMGKPCGQDAKNTRPSIVHELGIKGAMAQLKTQVEAAVSAVPDCEGADMLKSLIRNEATRLMPKSLAASAA